MTPPTMAGWNLALRFGLELAAIGGLAAWAWRTTDGTARWLTVIALPVAATLIWTVFNVPDDPSRSGGAPVEVSGWLRLTIELAILGLGAAALAARGPVWLGLTVGGLIIVHSLASTARLEWLLRQ